MNLINYILYYILYLRYLLYLHYFFHTCFFIHVIRHMQGGVMVLLIYILTLGM